MNQKSTTKLNSFFQFAISHSISRAPRVVECPLGLSPDGAPASYTPRRPVRFISHMIHRRVVPLFLPLQVREMYIQSARAYRNLKSSTFRIKPCTSFSQKITGLSLLSIDIISTLLFTAGILRIGRVLLP